MADESDEKLKKRPMVYSGDPHDESSYKYYPAKPTGWEQFKDYFKPTTDRIMLEQVRKRRLKPDDNSSDD